MKGRGSTPIRIEAEALRDHGDAERIDRVWERLDSKLTLGRPKRRQTTAMPMVAAALAAGFAIGVFTSGWFDDTTPRPEVALPEAAGVQAMSDVFAAGASPRSYALPSGGTITVEPGSIVDTVSREGNALTLNLVRGSASFVAPHDGSLELMIDRAHVAPAAGARVQVRREGDHAFVEVFEGAAEVTSPNADDEMVSSRMGPHESRRVRVRVTSARVPTDQQNPMRARPENSDEDPQEESVEPEGTPADVPPWVTACKVEKDDERTLELVQADPAALSQITDPEVLACVARGQNMAGNADAAIAAFEKVMNGSDTLRAYNAARSAQQVVRRQLRRAKTDAERQRLSAKLQAYGQKERSLALAAAAKDIDISGYMGAEGMCRRIKAEAGVATPNWDAVESFAAQYKKAFPGGDCIASINGILAKRPTETDDAESDAPGSDSDSPYEESEAP